MELGFDLFFVETQPDAETVRQLFLTEPMFQDIDALNCVPQSLLSGPSGPEICLAAVSRNGAALKFVPWRYKNANLCSVAVANCPSALRFVPLKLRTLEICTAALAAGPEILENIPGKILMSPRGFEACLSTARKDGLMTLMNLPQKILRHPRVHELYTEAVIQNPVAIMYVNHRVIGYEATRELAMRVVTQNGMDLRCMNLEWINRDICLAAVKQNGSALVYVPYLYKDLEMCKAALAQNPDVMMHIPEDILLLIEGTPLNPEIVPLPEDLDISEMEDPVGLEPLSEMKDMVYGFVEHAPGKYVPAGTLEMFRNLISSKMFKCTRTELFVAQFNKVEHISKFIWCTLP